MKDVDFFPKNMFGDMVMEKNYRIKELVNYEDQNNE
jgi:hypothetical protein